MKKNFRKSIGKTFLSAIAASSLLMSGPCARAEFKPLFGEATQANGILTAKTNTVVELSMAADASILTVRGKTGTERGGVTITLLGENGKNVVNEQGKSMTGITLFAADLKLHGSDILYPDTFIQMPHPLRYFVRPNLNFEGNFEVREVNDPEMGKCIEVEHKPGRGVRLGAVEYLTLKLAKPITASAKNAGVWIKGNGSWGDVDILKNHWGPWADNGNLHMNWPGDASMNFESWNFIKYPYYEWSQKAPVYQTTIVSGLRITFPRNTLVGTERVPVPNQKVRIKGMLLC